MHNTKVNSINVLFCFTVFRLSTFSKTWTSFSLLVRASFVQFQYLKYEMLKQNKI